MLHAGASSLLFPPHDEAEQVMHKMKPSLLDPLLRLQG